MINNLSARVGLARFSAYDVLPVTRFRDVPILPSTEMTQGTMNGGPQLPNWGRHVELRDGSGGVPHAVALPQTPRKLKTLNEAIVWGGAIYPSLANQVADTVGRILISAKQRPNDRIAFVMPPGKGAADVPASFWEILAWYGVAEDAVLIVEEPICVAELSVAPQIEQVPGLGPSYDALELIAQNTDSRGLSPVEHDIVYVSRKSAFESGTGAWIGEAYLAKQLGNLGVTVIDSDSVDLEERLALYAGAKTLVFGTTDDAAARLLLGFYDQDIVILNQPRHTRFAMANLTPRCRQLIYAEGAMGQLTLVPASDANPLEQTVATLEIEPVFRAFQLFDIDLRAIWKPEAYAQSAKQDLVAWLKYHRAQQGKGQDALPWDTVRAEVDPVLRSFGGRFAEDPDVKAFLARKPKAGARKKGNPSTK